MRWLMKILFSLFIMFFISGCLPFDKELQVMLNKNNILQEMYVKENITG